MTFSVAERSAVVEAYINTGSIKETREISGSNFPGKGLPAKRAIQVLQLVYILTSYTTINIIIHTIKCYKFNG